MKLSWNYKTKRSFMATTKRQAAKGVSCLFVRIDRRTGIKLYSSKVDRDTTYLRQKHAHEHGIAPALGDKFRITKKEHPKLYAAVEKYLKRKCPGDWYYRKHRMACYGYVTQAASMPRKGLSDDQYYDLCDTMGAIGYTTGDLGRYRNVGLIGKKPVCIDFDPVSMGTRY